jgi:hypothetical protein
MFKSGLLILISIFLSPSIFGPFIFKFGLSILTFPNPFMFPPISALGISTLILGE